MAANKKLLMLPGDGIGPEVMGEVKRVIGWMDKPRHVSFDIDMGLIGGCAYDAEGTPLSDKTMDKVRKETDTSAVKDSGFGGSIERFVKKTVQSTLGQQFEYPMSDVRDARYENGAIVLDVNGREPRLLANTKVGGKKLLESFRPEDAQRFVAAVNAKKAR